MYALLFLVAYLEWTAAAALEKKIVCIFTRDTMDVSDIDPTLCTHLTYNVALVNNGDVEITDRDEWGNGSYTILSHHRQKNPSLKILTTLQGRQEDFIKCSQVMSNSTCWEKVVDNIVKFTKLWGFDGVHLFWLFEHFEPDPPEVQQNFIQVLKVLRARCDEMGLILCAGAYPTEVDAFTLYDIPEMSKYLDFILLKSHGWYDATNQQTAICTPLRARFDDDAADKTKNVEACVLYWLSQGVPKDKLLVGVTASGCSFTLNHPNENEIGASILGHGVAGRRTNQPGSLWYNEICELQKSGGWNVIFDEEHREPYTFKGDQWIAYDNVKAVREKAEFIARLNFGGAVFADMGGDDYLGTCGEKWPLLKTLNAVLRNGGPVPEESLPVITPRPKCPRSGYFRDFHSCGLIFCTPNTTGGYNEFYLECMPGNCDNPILGKSRAESIDVNFFICGD